ncbi:MAG: MinD/ParA family protein [Mariprofundaceae bacterium]
MNSTKSTPRVIAVSSGKGGVGKTFFSVHLADCATRQGQRVLVLDADLGLANVDVMLGISSKGSVLQVVNGEVPLADMVVKAQQGFDVLPGGSGLFELTNLNAEQQQVLLDEMREATSDYDLIIIDTAAGIGENVLYFASAAESSLIVLTPDPTSLTDAYALIKVMSQRRAVRRFMVVVNQADNFDAQLAFRRLLSVSDRYLDVHLDYVGHMPQYPDVRQAIQRQTLLNEASAPLATQHMEEVTKAVLSRPRDISRSSGLQFFWEHSLNQELNMDAAS